MGSVNKVMLLGNLGRDPEIRFTPNGTKVATLSVATSRRWKDKQSDEPKEATDWHRVVVWGRQAEVAEEYLKKGSPVHVEGRLQTRSWTDKDENKRYSTEVIAQRLQLVGKAAGSVMSSPPDVEQAPDGGDPEPEVDPEDIPF